MSCRRAVKRGDIVLFKAKTYCGNFVLHRIIKVRDGEVLTMGDGNLASDRWISIERLYGVAVRAKRGAKELNLQGIAMHLEGKFWVRILPLRPALLKMAGKRRSC